VNRDTDWLVSPSSKSSVKHGEPVVGTDIELVEKLSRNDP
jgi:hypothetical protein